jgi:hypothetical protein
VSVEVVKLLLPFCCSGKRPGVSILPAGPSFCQQCSCLPALLSPRDLVTPSHALIFSKKATTFSTSPSSLPTAPVLATHCCHYYILGSFFCQTCIYLIFHFLPLRIWSRALWWTTELCLQPQACVFKAALCPTDGMWNQGRGDDQHSQFCITDFGIVFNVVLEY